MKVGQIGQFVVQTLHFLTGSNLIKYNFTLEMDSDKILISTIYTFIKQKKHTKKYFRD